MPKNAAQNTGKGNVASSVYCLGDALNRFRHYTEVNYVGVSDSDVLCNDRREVPEIIEKSFGEVLEYAHRVADALPAVKLDAQALIDLTCSVWAHIGQVWLDVDHRARLRQRRSKEERADGAGNCYFDWLVLSESSLDVGAWSEFLTAINRLEGNLPAVYGPLLRLGRLLSEISYPLPSEYDSGLKTIPVLVPHHILTVIRPQIVTLVRAIRAGSGLLEEVRVRFRGSDAYSSAVRFHRIINKELRGCTRGSDQLIPDVEAIPAQTAAIAIVSYVPASSAAELDVVPDEDIAALLELKRRMDQKGDYVGESLQVLQLFERIEELNRRSDEPVVILGPTGSGKTTLAYLIHKTSDRADQGFLDLQANDVVGGDEGIVRAKWVGRGKNAGLSGAGGNDAVLGWLQEYAGGTIFIDELHNIGDFNQQYLRKVYDRRPIPLAAGSGDPIIPDVRLIFATFKNLDELLKNKVLDEDFLRRLEKQHLIVPALNDRKEDIPLFVEKFRDGRKPTLEFLFALLSNNWSVGQVGELRHAIRTAVARKPVGKRLLASDLKGVVSREVLDMAQQAEPHEIRRVVLDKLVVVLTRQGYRLRDKKAPLNQRLAELLFVSEATISRWLKTAGIRME